MSLSTAPNAFDPALLPSSSSPDLIVVPVTPAEFEQTWHINSSEWRGPLSLSQYLERERFLIQQDLTRDDGITAWILTSVKLPHNPDGTRPILAACETLLKSAYVARNGSIEKVRAHGVASVYTRKEYRGKGYAGRMMAELAKHLETYQQLNGEQATFSVLYSDIGKDFYARYGWAPFPSTHIHLPPVSAEQYQRIRTQFATVDDLRKDDLKELPTASYLEGTLETISRQKPNTPHVAIRPDVQHFAWHHAREEVQAQLLGLPEPLVKGAIDRSTGIAIIWNRVFAANKHECIIHVLHIAIPPQLRENPTEEAKSALAALLLRTQYEASSWELISGVKAFDPSESIIAAAQSSRMADQGEVEIVHRDKYHVCCLRWNGAKPGDDETGSIVWVNAEDYAWN